MPIVNEKPKYPKIPHQPTVTIVKDPYKSVVVDSKYDPVENLLTHVEGSSYTVNYYSQVLTKDSPLAGPMVNREAIYQQYILINNLELKVNTPLTYVQDDTTKSIKGTGGATIYAMTVIPNVGDTFIADMGNGATGIFRVTTSERKSIFKSTVYSIEYVLLETSVNDEAFMQRMDDINSKVVDTVEYVQDFMQHGQNPLLHKEEYSQLKKLGNYFFNIRQRYFKLFTSTEFRTLLLPGQLMPTYDHYLMKMVMSMFNIDEDPNIQYLRILNVQDDDVMSATNIWDLLKQKDLKLLKYCFRKTGIVTAMSFTQNPMLDGIYHTGVQFVVYPLDPNVAVDYQRVRILKPVYECGLMDPPSQIKDLSDLIGNSDFNGLTLPENPVIKKVLIDNYYVLSEAFYTKDRDDMSLLELCTMDYLEDKAANIDVLLEVCETSHAWGLLEQFYYSIIILILIKSVIRSL